MSSLPISYQIVGTYGYFPFEVENSPLEKPLEGLDIETSTIDNILDAVEDRVNSLPDNKDSLLITNVDKNTALVSYRFKEGVSLVPINATMPTNGTRVVRTRTYVPSSGDDSQTFTGVIQYYRSVTVFAKDDASQTQFTINLRSKGQPDVVSTTFFDSLADFDTPEDAMKFLEPYEIISYNIIQRTVLIELQGVLQAKYAKISGLLDEKSDEINSALAKGQKRLRYKL
ncbi:MAG: hypothetical protein AAF611_12120 [Bacteroidota bacterium]